MNSAARSTSTRRRSRGEASLVWLISAGWAAAFLVYQGHVGFNIADEGFLWLGTIQTALGEIPIRDFQAYAPGRYYALAPFLWILDHGLISMRIGLAVCQSVALASGLWIIRRVTGSWSWVIAAGGVFALWMLAPYKQVDNLVTMAGMFVAYQLLVQPSVKRHLVAGLLVGFAAIMGYNHGFYLGVSFFALIAYISFKGEREWLVKRFFATGLGVFLAYLPMLLMLLIPGMFPVFWDNLLNHIHRGATNISLPVPWPWTVPIFSLPWHEAVARICLGLFFLGIPVFYLVTAVFFLPMKRTLLVGKAALLAAIFVGIPYLHYAFSRADVWHLSIAVHPFFIGLVGALDAVEDKWIKRGVWAVILAVLVSSVLVNSRQNPAFSKAFLKKETFVRYDICGDEIWIPKRQASFLTTLNEVKKQFIPEGENVLIVPYGPGLYPLLDLMPPIRESFLLVHATPKRQRQIIRDLEAKHVDWAIVWDQPLQEGFGFRQTHPLVWQYIDEHFSVVPSRLPQTYFLMHRNSDAGVD